MTQVYDTILRNIRRGKKMLVRLIDPDKFDPGTLPGVPKATHAQQRIPADFDFYFVGGSTADDCSSVVRTIHQTCTTPVILFPGNPKQFTPEADALLFLTLMNSRDPRFLIDWQVQAAPHVILSGIESIPMGYILISGGITTATQRLTSAEPIPQTDTDTIIRLAQTAELLGKRLIYLEAGSGALNPVCQEVIRAVRNAVSLPLIVGGGICSPSQMQQAFNAGADIVVIGNHFERHPEEIKNFIGPM